MATNNTTDNNINVNESFIDFECEDKWVYTDENSLMEKPSSPMDSTVFVNNIAKEFGNLSIEAQKCIESHFEKNTIRRIRENMEPDGFSRDGPEAETWDLYVQTNDDKVHKFSYYYNWNHAKREKRDGYTIDE